jgi:hypothetical protein
LPTVRVSAGSLDRIYRVILSATPDLLVEEHDRCPSMRNGASAGIGKRDAFGATIGL